MPILSGSFTVHTKGFTDIIDITEKVKDIVYKHSLKDAQVSVFVSGSTASVTTIEYEPGLLKDLPEAYEKFAPMEQTYHHDETWHDGNGYAHVRASITGNSATFPVIEGALELGTWQQIVLIDFDNRSRTRKIIVQIVH